MEPNQDGLHRVLEEIRDDQKKLLAQNQQALDLSKEQFELVKSQHERAGKIQDRAEALQTRGEGLVGGARKVFLVVVPILIALLIYVSWLLFGLIM